MKTYLPDATDFTDMKKKSRANPDHVECPLCHGYGQWNLLLNEYPNSTVPEHRHFRAFCRQCWGWGYVEAGPDAECVHEWKEIAPDQPWRCWHTIACAKCGRKRSYDSSD